MPRTKVVVAAAAAASTADDNNEDDEDDEDENDNEGDLQEEEEEATDNDNAIDNHIEDGKQQQRITGPKCSITNNLTYKGGPSTYGKKSNPITSRHGHVDGRSNGQLCFEQKTQLVLKFKTSMVT